MATDTTISKVEYPSYITDRQQQLLNELFGTTGSPGGLIDKGLDVPGKKVAGLQQPTLDAIRMAQQGIGAYEPFLQGAGASQQSALATTRAGQEALANMQFDPNAIKQYMDPYQQDVTNEALKEIDRQAAMQENQLAGKAAQAGAFGGSRFGLQQSETARNAQDLKSRRIFEDLSRNYQQAQAAAQAANTQRLQQGQTFGQLGQMTSGIGGAMAGLGAQTQALGQQDVSQLMGIGGMQQQLAQTGLNTAYQNQLAQQNAPYQQLSSAAGILQQLSPQVMGQQTTAPLPQTNPFAQAAGLIATGAGGLGALMR